MIVASKHALSAASRASHCYPAFGPVSNVPSEFDAIDSGGFRDGSKRRIPRQIGINGIIANIAN